MIRGMESRESRRVELVLPLRTVVLVVATLAVMAAFVAIGDTFLVVFVGIFLALVFEFPVRFVMAQDGAVTRAGGDRDRARRRGSRSRLLALLFLVRIVGSVRDFLQDLPAIVEQLRQSDELSFLGDTGAAENVQKGAQNVCASGCPTRSPRVLGLAGPASRSSSPRSRSSSRASSCCRTSATSRGALASVLAPGDEERWLAVWERVTESVSRWAIGVIVIAIIAGTTQGVTAWLLGSSYAVALGVIAGLLDMIPNLGATIAGFILVPVILAEEGLTAALIMLAVVLVYQQVENNVITPKVQGKAVHLSGFFIIVAVTLFGALLGVLGALTAVPLAAMIQIFVQELTKARREQVAAAKAALEPARGRAPA